MIFDIKATGIELTDGILTAVEKRLKTLDKKVERFGDVVRAVVEVGKETAHHKKGQIFRAEIIIRLPGKRVYAEASSEDLYKAIGDAKTEAERQVVGFKEMLDAKQKRGARTAKNIMRGDALPKGARPRQEI